jgi:hypothetical protein
MIGREGKHRIADLEVERHVMIWIRQVWETMIDDGLMREKGMC